MQPALAGNTATARIRPMAVFPANAGISGPQPASTPYSPRTRGSLGCNSRCRAKRSRLAAAAAALAGNTATARIRPMAVFPANAGISCAPWNFLSLHTGRDDGQEGEDHCAHGKRGQPLFGWLSPNCTGTLRTIPHMGKLRVPRRGPWQCPGSAGACARAFHVDLRHKIAEMMARAVTGFGRLLHAMANAQRHTPPVSRPPEALIALHDLKRMSCNLQAASLSCLLRG
jgi:hypothetical protein